MSVEADQTYFFVLEEIKISILKKTSEQVMGFRIEEWDPEFIY